MESNSRTNYVIRNVVILMDFVVLNVLFLVYYKLDLHLFNSVAGVSPRLTLLIANLAMAIAQYFFCTIIHKRKVSSDEVLRQVTLLIGTQAITTYVFTKMLFVYLWYHVPDSGFIFHFAVLLYFILLLVRFSEREAIKRFRRMGKNTRFVTLVGSDQALLNVFTELVSDSSMGYQVTGYYADTQMANAPATLPRLGTLKELLDKMDNAEFSSDELYCSLPARERKLMQTILHYCDANMIHFYFMPVIDEFFGTAFKAERIGNITVFSNYETPLMSPTNRLIKRIFDILVSSIVLIGLIPIIPVIALIIKIQSPGPIFFKQERTGQNGGSFMCYKFRSMHVNKDADKIQATEHDPRKFAFGNLMRKANIDELPQFFNVFKGDMSIVGPRPHMLHHTEVYSQLISKYMVRHFVKPGITGWAQVTGFRGETKELWQMEGRVKRDIWYMENWSIWLDLRIIWLTAKQLVVHDKNAY